MAIALAAVGLALVPIAVLLLTIDGWLAKARHAAMSEFSRVAGPRGQILLVDFSGIDTYVSALNELGWDVSVSPIKSMFPWSHVLLASRPAT
ncbi:MAG: hypothetical protein WBM90_12045 [Acidimicrobiia bacterium]